MGVGACGPDIGAGAADVSAIIAYNIVGNEADAVTPAEVNCVISVVV